MSNIHYLNKNFSFRSRIEIRNTINMTEVTSYTLRYGKLQLDDIKDNVRRILSDINDYIQEAHDRCETHISVPLPFNFDIPNLNKLQARKKIYALVIEDLTSAKRGFAVRLKYIPDNSASLDITWFTEEDELLRQHENEILEYYSKPFGERDSTKRPQSLSFEERIKHYSTKSFD